MTRRPWSVVCVLVQLPRSYCCHASNWHACSAVLHCMLSCVHAAVTAVKVGPAGTQLVTDTVPACVKPTSAAVTASLVVCWILSGSCCLGHHSCLLGGHLFTECTNLFQVLGMAFLSPALAFLTVCNTAGVSSMTELLEVLLCCVSLQNLQSCVLLLVYGPPRWTCYSVSCAVQRQLWLEAHES